MKKLLFGLFFVSLNAVAQYSYQQHGSFGYLSNQSGIVGTVQHLGGGHSVITVTPQTTYVPPNTQHYYIPSHGDPVTTASPSYSGSGEIYVPGPEKKLAIFTKILFKNGKPTSLDGKTLHYEPVYYSNYEETVTLDMPLSRDRLYFIFYDNKSGSSGYKAGYSGMLSYAVRFNGKKSWPKGDYSCDYTKGFFFEGFDCKSI